MVNGMYNEAAEEFGKCLAHRTALPDPVSRGVADAHVRRAQALFYASTLEGADKVGHERPPLFMSGPFYFLWTEVPGSLVSVLYRTQ